MLPTTRALLLLLITVPLLALGTWFPFMQWVAWAYALLILAMIYTDWRMAGKITQFDLIRAHDTKLSLGAENPIRLSLRNRSWRGSRLHGPGRGAGAVQDRDAHPGGTCRAARNLGICLSRPPAAARGLPVRRSESALAGAAGTGDPPGQSGGQGAGEGLSQFIGCAPL